LDITPHIYGADMGLKKHTFPILFFIDLVFFSGSSFFLDGKIRSILRVLEDECPLVAVRVQKIDP
jgi:hypothetical protein